MKPKVKIRNGIFGANDVSIKDVEYPNEPAMATKRLPNLFTKWGNMGPEKYLNTYIVRRYKGAHFYGKLEYFPQFGG